MSAPRPAASPGAARARRAARLCGRCRPRPAACAPARRDRDRLARSRPTSARSILRRSAEPPDLSSSTSASSRSSWCCRRRWRWLRDRAQPGRADQAAIRGRPHARSRKASCAIRPCTPRSATTSRPSSPRSAGASAASSPRRSRAATAIANSLGARAWLSGSRSRGSAIAATASPRRRRARSTCPTRCRARPSRSSRGPAIPTGAILLQRRDAERRAHRADLSAFRRLRRLRDAALGRARLSRLEARPRGRGAAAGRPRRAGRRPDRRARRGPPPRGISRARAARTTCSKSASRRRARTTSLPSTVARCWRPRSTARSPAAWAHRRGARRARRSRSTSR